MQARVFSGIQPTGSPHIGNYLGALKNWAKIQYDYDSIYCIVDLHAITLYQEPAELRQKIEELAGMLLAIGIDPKHSSLIVQSAALADVDKPPTQPYLCRSVPTAIALILLRFLPLNLSLLNSHSFGG